MQIESIAVRHEDAGNLVTVGFRFASNEDLTAEDIVRVYDLLKEISGPSKSRREQLAEEIEKATFSTDLAGRGDAKVFAGITPQIVEEALPAEGRRRRRGNALGNPEEEAASDAASPPSSAASPIAAAADTSTAAPDGGRRRRRASSTESPSTTAAEPAEASEQETPCQPETTTRRRRRGAEDAPSAPETSEPAAPPAAAPAEEPQRRRRRSSADAPPLGDAPSPAASPSTDISDADLSKAASEGARALTPKVVMEYLASLGVKTTGELKGGQRREFLDGIKAKIARAS